MTQAFTHEILSGSTDGKTVPVVATGTPGTIIHTAIASATSRDEVVISAVNNDADGETRTLWIEWGDVVGTSGWSVPVPAGAGLVPITDGQPIRNGLVVRAYADEGSDLQIVGHVHRVTVA